MTKPFKWHIYILSFFIDIILAENMYLINEFIWKTSESFSTTELQIQQILYILLLHITLICINNRSLFSRMLWTFIKLIQIMGKIILIQESHLLTSTSYVLCVYQIKYLSLKNAVTQSNSLNKLKHMKFIWIMHINYQCL